MLSHWAKPPAEFSVFSAPSSWGGDGAHVIIWPESAVRPTGAAVPYLPPGSHCGDAGQGSPGPLLGAGQEQVPAGGLAFKHMSSEKHMQH